MSRIVARMTRAALLDAQIYEEVEADRSATPQAFAVVVLASIAAVTCVIGTRILPRAETVSDLGELLRTLGFASSPGILLVFAAIPAISPYVFPVCGVWMLAAMVVAVRQALDYEGRGGTARSIAVCAIGFPIYALLLAIALLAFGPWPI